MKLSTVHAVVGSAVVLLSCAGHATASHRHMHKLFENRHNHLHVHRTEEPASLEKRGGGTCAFPSDEADVVAVTPGSSNGGWAMSPDQQCEYGGWCPYACKPGMVMAQWDPDSTYTYPASMNGGVFCDNSGSIKKPFPDKPYCVEGTGAVKAVNKCGKDMSWCQTVLPGNEAMLIPTLVSSIATIAVPDTSYWQATAAHFYLNPPGSTVEDCVWGDDSKDVGNWSPVVAGANTDSSGQTFVKLGMNPIYESSSLMGGSMTFGVEILCEDGAGCNGLPCKIDPSGKVQSGESSVGAGGAGFCVVTVPKGQTAQIVAYSAGSDAGSPAPDDTTSDSAPPTTAEKPTTTAEPTTSTTPTTTSTPTPTTTSTTSTTSAAPTSTSKAVEILGGIFHENGTDSTTTAHHSTTATRAAATTSTLSESAPVPTTKDDKNEGRRQQGSAAFAGLVVAFIAAACFF